MTGERPASRSSSPPVAARRLLATARARAAEAVRQSTIRDLAPLLLPLVLLPWIVDSFSHYVHHTLYFDPINYQYTAWCIRHGERLYDTVGVPDGPFITMLHAAVQMVVGESDAAFRRADLWIHTLGAAAMGLTLAPVPGTSVERGRVLVVRLVWALVAAALWLAYYLTFDWHWTVQREAYYSLFGYLGVALLYASATYAPRAARVAAFAGGALVGAQLLGKHSGVIFVAVGLFVVTIGDRSWRPRRPALLLANAVAGVAAGVLLMLGTVVIWGSLRGFLFWYLRFPFGYRNAMVGASVTTLLLHGNAAAQKLAGLALVGGLLGVATKLLPRRAVGFALTPAAFYLAMALQRKGYPYHLHPVEAGACVLALVLLTALWRDRGDEPTRRWSKRHTLAGAAALALVGGIAVSAISSGPWLDPGAYDEHTNGNIPSTNYPALYAVADFLASHTKEGDRIFTYGPAPAILMRAGRAMAVPEFNGYFFNIRRATTAALSDDDRRALDALQETIAKDACPRLQQRPAAMVFCDGAEWSRGPGIDNASEVCPEIRGIVRSEYRPSMSSGCWRVYLRTSAPR